MAFGRHAKPDDDDVDDDGEIVESAGSGEDELDGPFDIDDFDDPAAATHARLDLGSVLIPMPEVDTFISCELSIRPGWGVPSIWLSVRSGLGLTKSRMSLFPPGTPDVGAVGTAPKNTMVF